MSNRNAGALWTPEQFCHSVYMATSDEDTPDIEIVASGIGYDVDEEGRLTAVLCQFDSMGVIHVELLVREVT